MNAQTQENAPSMLEKIGKLFDDICGFNAGNDKDVHLKQYNTASQEMYKLFKNHSDGIFFLSEEELNLLQDAQEKKRELQSDFDSYKKEIKDKDCIYEGEVPERFERGFKLAELLLSNMTAEKISQRKVRDAIFRAGTEKVDGNWKKVIHETHPRKSGLWDSYREKSRTTIEEAIQALEAKAESEALLEQEVRKLEYFQERLSGNEQE